MGNNQHKAKKKKRKKSKSFYNNYVKMESGKRKYEADVSDGAIRSEKRTKISHKTVTLLHLSDDVLILILRLLSSHDLLNLSYVCERFDTRDSPLKPNRFRKLLRHMGRKTRIIRLGGNVF